MIQQKATHPCPSVSTSLCCPACGSKDVHDAGTLPDFPDEVADVWLEAGMTPGSLYRCSICTLQFRLPVPQEDQLLRIYKGLSAEDMWNHGERQVWHRIRRILETCPERTVLEVGCFRGDFLEWLGDSWHRFGVEPSASARREAEKRGIRILAESIEGLQIDNRRFGAIVMIDVIEHLPLPLHALSRLSRALAPQGKLILFTASTDALSWRISGHHYWYSALPEHVSFFQPHWFRWAAARLGCRLDRVERMAHGSADLGTRLDQALKNILYIAYRRLSKGNRFGSHVVTLPLLRRVGRWKLPWWTSAKDHILASMVSQSEQKKNGLS